MSAVISAAAPATAAARVAAAAAIKEGEEQAEDADLRTHDVLRPVAGGDGRVEDKAGGAVEVEGRAVEADDVLGAVCTVRVVAICLTHARR